MGSLSGGKQKKKKKLLLAAGYNTTGNINAGRTNSAVIDVGAKFEIYQLMLELAKR